MTGMPNALARRNRAPAASRSCRPKATWRAGGVSSAGGSKSGPNREVVFELGLGRVVLTASRCGRARRASLRAKRRCRERESRRRFRGQAAVRRRGGRLAANARPRPGSHAASRGPRRASGSLPLAECAAGNGANQLALRSRHDRRFQVALVESLAEFVDAQVRAHGRRTGTHDFLGAGSGVGVG